ncbi:amidase [Anoxybacillus flavithermus]|nr:amidase [Anoxybacillus flavithermus]
MKKIAVLLIFMYVLVVGGVCLFAQERQFVRATWLWNPWLFVKDENLVLSFLQEKQVSDVYVQIDEEVSIDTYRQFIRRATEKGIRVYALDGAPNWIEHPEELERFFRWIDKYENAADVNEKFFGVHLDIEPYLHTWWRTNEQGAIASYQTVLQRGHELAKERTLRLEVDMPFWFDEVSYGSTNLAEWVIANTDGVTMMAYRDQARDIIDIVKKEMQIARKYGKQIVVGIETGQVDEGDNVSFFEEDEAYMNKQLAIVQRHYGRTKSFSGIAVHHLEQWMNRNEKISEGEMDE